MEVSGGLMNGMNRQKSRKNWRTIKIGNGCPASVTVEAALLYPILIFVVMFCLSRTIGLYEMVRETAEVIYIEETVDTIDIFRKKLQMEKIEEALQENGE